ncbi:hypothetical protein [uncultured Eubacterium sp.]|uniref:hypothetical protein n=1 Tax=uncultured Eubacterium sp. TaxID=165185 RepID=UPI0015B250EC|nr:hypothetical protein [uncultured Eubacterium sp.]
MSGKTSRTLMKCVGATLAVCSAMAITGGCCSNSSGAKKSMKKTVNKFADIIDTVSDML